MARGPAAAAARCPAVLLAALLLLLPQSPHAQARFSREAETTTTTRPATVAAIALSIKSRAIQDSRCYLMNGGAVESFFVSEDTPVGSVIGTLSVNGDPSEESGDILLRLQEKGAAVGVAAGSRNLTLLRALDREERAGPSNVYVNVRCDRRRTSDPSFIIPVSVRVWDVNDNAPVWSGTPYSVRLSELTAVGSRILHAVKATDADQPGPHATIHYSVLPGENSEYFGFANELDSVLVLKKPLDFESQRNFTVTLRAQDQGRPPLHSDAPLAVTVLDADDQNPKFSHEHYSALLPEEAKEGTELITSPGPIAANDQDVGLNAPLYYSVTGDQRTLVAVDKDSGRMFVTENLLRSNLPVTVVVKATQYDNADRYALATLTIARLSTPPRAVRFSKKAYSTAVGEDTPPGAVLTALQTNYHRNEDTPPLQFYVSDRSFLEKFAINSGGEVLLRRALDYETSDSYHYQVMVTDGVANDTASLNITVLNVNDWEPRFRYPQYEFRVEGGGGGGGDARSGLMPVGKVDVFDGDKGDYVALSLRGPDASLFYINDMGEMYMKEEALTTLNSSVVHVMATAVDSGTPPRQTSVPVIVHVSPALLTAGRGAVRGGAVLAVFAAALAALALLVLALLFYIYRAKRSKTSSSSPTPSSKPSSGFVQHEKLPPLEAHGGGGSGSGSARVQAAAAEPTSGSLLSVSAGASTILANSCSSLDLRGGTLPSLGAGRQSQRFPAKARVAPAPPHSPGEPSPALMSDHLQAGGGRSGVAWPAATIPARVKKLSWDDAEKGSAECQAPGELHDATNPALADHMNLTVYF